MSKKRSTQILIVGMCMIVSILGLYFQFIHKDKDVKKAASKEDCQSLENGKDEKSMDDYDYRTQSLPDTDNQSDGERYAEGKEVEVYFSNTGVLDQSGLPLNAQSDLCKSSQNFLRQAGYNDVTELYIVEEQFEEGEKKIKIRCLMDGYKEQLQIVYLKAEAKLQFRIVLIDKIAD